MAENTNETVEEQVENTEPETEQDAAQKEEEVLDKHGQPGINKERHEREVAELNEKIAALQKQVDEAAETKKGREELGAKIAQLETDLANERLASKLEKAGCIDVEIAKAVIDKYDGDVEKLKAEKPFLFEVKKKGATGGKPAGAADGSKALEQKFRDAAGLRKSK